MVQLQDAVEDLTHLFQLLLGGSGLALGGFPLLLGRFLTRFQKRIRPPELVLVILLPLLAGLVILAVQLVEQLIPLAVQGVLFALVMLLERFEGLLMFGFQTAELFCAGLLDAFALALEVPFGFFPFGFPSGGDFGLDCLPFLVNGE